jgi:DNA-directed RNA polymerase specialized sigma24 family protein
VERSLPIREALHELARRNPRCARVVHLRFCEDLSLEEVVRQTGLSLATVKRDLKVGLKGLRALLQH